jgi:HSP20 family protein
MFELIPWRRRERETFPMSVHRDFRREFDALINRFFGEERLLPGFIQGFSPAIDLSESDDDFTVKAEIPGVGPKDLDISLTGDVLTIKGEKKEEKEEKEKGVHRVERTFGRFSRSFSLPCEVQEAKIEAKFENGVVTIKLPKAETAKKKSIQIDMK